MPYIYATDPERQSHELFTLGGLISPVRVVAEKMLAGIEQGENEMSLKYVQQFRQMVTDATVLLRAVVDAGYTASQQPLTPQAHITRYHQKFCEWKILLERFVRLADAFMASTPPTLRNRHTLQEWIDLLRAWLTIEDPSIEERKKASLASYG